MLMDDLARNWWVFAIRGLAALLFGLFALFVPGITILSLVLVFAAYAVVDGVFAITAAVRAGKAHKKWGALALEGLVGILAGIVTAVWPGLSVLFFVALIAIWAIFTGLLLLTAGVKVDAGHGRWWMVLAAVCSIAFGALLIIAPQAGAVVLAWWIGAYALLFAVAMLAFAFRLKAKFDHLKRALPQ